VTHHDEIARAVDARATATRAICGTRRWQRVYLTRSGKPKINIDIDILFLLLLLRSPDS